MEFMGWTCCSNFAPSPDLIVRILDRSIVIRGRHLDVPRREFEVTLALATHSGFARCSQLGTLIWPDLEPEAAASFAKVYVSRLRRRLGADRDIIATTRNGYLLTQSFALDIELIGESLSVLRIPNRDLYESRVYDAILVKLRSLQALRT